MTHLTRRGMLTGAAAISTTALSIQGHSPARAAAPPAGKQAPGFYRYKVGDIEVTAVTDGARTFPLPDNFVKNAPKEAVGAAMSSMYMDAGKAMAPFTPVVVNTGSKLVVIDTGLGPATFEQSKGAMGQFHGNLAAAGIDRNAVDTVIISHFHGDHINGLLGADGKPAFPNAEIMVPAAEWKFWSDDGEMGKAAGGVKQNFENVRKVFGAHNNKVTQYEAGKELVPGITSVATPGHTPGHASHLVASGNSKVLVQADVTAAIGLLFVRNPGWHAVFDMDGGVAEATRRKVYDMAATDKLMIQGFHFPFPALGYIEKDGANYRLVPVAWSPVI